MMVSNGPVSFKGGLQGTTAQSTMESELVVAELALRGAVYCANTMEEPGFGGAFSCDYIKSSSTPHGTGNHTVSSRAKHVDLSSFCIHELMQEHKVRFHYVPTEKNVSDLGTKFPNKYRHRYLIGLIKYFKARTSITGSKGTILRHHGYILKQI